MKKIGFRPKYKNGMLVEIWEKISRFRNDQLTGNWVYWPVGETRKFDLHQGPSNVKILSGGRFSGLRSKFETERIFWNWAEDLVRPRMGRYAGRSFSHETIAEVGAEIKFCSSDGWRIGNHSG